MALFMVFKIGSIFSNTEKNGLTNSIQIWHVVIIGFQSVRYLKVTLNSHVLKSYIEFTLFFHRVY